MAGYCRARLVASFLFGALIDEASGSIVLCFAVSYDRFLSKSLLLGLLIHACWMSFCACPVQILVPLQTSVMTVQ